jgi:thiol:disulfide interchange protein DsbD
MVLLALALWSAAPSVRAQEEAASHVDASLIAESDTVPAGGLVTVAVRLIAKDGWHTYWKNPGDSGMATRVDWKAIDGFVAQPLQWPAPERIVLPRVVDYGFPGDAMILSELKAPSDFKKAELRVRVKWLECLKTCIPGSADLSLKLTEGKPSIDPERKALFAKARSRIPVPLGSGAFAGWEADVSRKDETVVLYLQPPQGAKLPKDASIDFFPSDNELVRNEAHPKVAREGDIFEIKLPAVPDSEAEQLSGVAVISPSGDAAELSVPVP